MYTNPYGYVGARSSFSKCYDPSADQMTEGVWTGSLTDVVAPEGYVTPVDCAASEYSECDSDDDCSLAVDTETCECYVSSYFHPYDPCDGAPNCGSEDQCPGEECDGREATCRQGVGGHGGTCQADYSPSDGRVSLI